MPKVEIELKGIQYLAEALCQLRPKLQQTLAQEIEQIMAKKNKKVSGEKAAVRAATKETRRVAKVQKRIDKIDKRIAKMQEKKVKLEAKRDGVKVGGKKSKVDSSDHRAAGSSKMVKAKK